MDIDKSRQDTTKNLWDFGTSPQYALNQIAKTIVYLGDCVRYLADKNSEKEN
jgi:maltoporin